MSPVQIWIVLLILFFGAYECRIKISSSGTTHSWGFTSRDHPKLIIDGLDTGDPDQHTLTLKLPWNKWSKEDKFVAAPKLKLEITADLEKCYKKSIKVMMYNLKGPNRGKYTLQELEGVYCRLRPDSEYFYEWYSSRPHIEQYQLAGMIKDGLVQYSIDGGHTYHKLKKDTSVGARVSHYDENKLNDFYEGFDDEVYDIYDDDMYYFDDYYDEYYEDYYGYNDEQSINAFRNGFEVGFAKALKALKLQSQKYKSESEHK